ncbi:MAG: hypothetical protein AB1847_00200 [bacterium]
MRSVESFIHTMKDRLPDKALLLVSYFYVFLPLIIFFATWLKMPLSFFSVLLVSTGLILSIRDFGHYKKYVCRKKSILLIFLACIMITGWVALSGIGGFGYQNWDHEFRNAIFRDLTNKRWPLYYDYTSETIEHSLAGHKGACVYYLGHWIVPACFGKMFGWRAGNIALFLWSTLGVLLVVFLLMRYFDSTSIVIPLVFILWSGMDIAGYDRNLIFGVHLEWWAQYFQYSSNTTLLYWVFNQSITPWLLFSLVLNQDNTKSILILYAVCFFYGPFPALGMTLYVLYLIVFGKSSRLRNMLTHKEERPDSHKEERPDFLHTLGAGLKSSLTFQNAVVSPVTLFILGMYFLSNPGNLSQKGIIWLLFPDKIWKLFRTYVKFCLYEFGLYVLLLYGDYKREPMFIITTILLFLIPHFSAGSSNDFAMRVSIIPLFCLMTFVIRFILTHSDEKVQREKKNALVFFLSLGSITPLYEIYRSILAERCIMADHIVTFSHLGQIGKEELFKITNFIAKDPEKTFFFKLLARK